ncbi:cilia- and flagella-associated protein 300 isoform X2 [Gouania willdenowi]|uniref:cilia- and flagella-associated protein 300 isoform X2 n=1 Tax=Gouania willdenowi TaxID=441366 RepID=UPI001056B073|nr:cilia- and flagella-associated protein 300 isoform X2 [Gouania willdenowi]
MKLVLLVTSHESMAGEKYPFELTFSFRPLPMQQFSFLQDKETLALLMKWSMLGRISAQAFSFDQSFYPYNSDQFALSFFRDPDVVTSMMEVGVRGPFDKPLVSVSVKIIPCTKVSMDLFDPIYSCGILMPSGHVVKCLHDVHPDYDELRQEEDSQHYDVIGKEEREEFIFLLFKHICLGGELCQYEDVIDPYISTTKKVYKDLISVQKDPETKKISVVSTVLKVCVYDESGRCFPGMPEEEQTFAYLIVNPFKRHVTLLYHLYGVGRLTL